MSGTNSCLSCAIFGLILLVGSGLVYAEDVGEDYVTDNGSWTLQKRTDTFTDKVSCLIIYNKPPGAAVQISLGGLYISYRGRGGIKGFLYRIDDGPVSRMQIPTDVEQAVDALHMSGKAFDSVLAAKRLRVETLTYVAGIVTEDLDLTGLSILYSKMKSICPPD